MKKLKVITILGTRPEIIRLSRTIPKLESYFDHVLVHTGQNYDPELNKNTFLLWSIPLALFLLGGAIIIRKFMVLKKTQ